MYAQKMLIIALFAEMQPSSPVVLRDTASLAYVRGPLSFHERVF